jgi:hypothetical protein
MPTGLAALHAYNTRFNKPPMNPGYGRYSEWARQSGLFTSMAAGSPGRLKPGVLLRQAQAEMDAVAARMDTRRLIPAAT